MAVNHEPERARVGSIPSTPTNQPETTKAITVIEFVRYI